MHNPPANPGFPGNSNNNTFFQQQGPPFHAQQQGPPPSYAQSIQPPPYQGHHYTQPPTYTYSAPIPIPRPSNPTPNSTYVYHSPNSYMQHIPNRPQQIQPAPFQQLPQWGPITPVSASWPPFPGPSGRYGPGPVHPLSMPVSHSPYVTMQGPNGFIWYNQNPRAAGPRMRGGGGDSDWDSHNEPQEHITDEEDASSPTPRHYFRRRQRATPRQRLSPAEAAFDTARQHNLEAENSDSSMPEETFPGTYGLRPPQGHSQGDCSSPDSDPPRSSLSTRRRYAGAHPEHRRRERPRRGNSRQIHASVEDDDSEAPRYGADNERAEARREPLRELVNFGGHHRRNAVDLTSTQDSTLAGESAQEPQDASRNRARRSAAPSPPERGELRLRSLRHYLVGGVLIEEPQDASIGDSDIDNSDENPPFYFHPHRPPVLLSDAVMFDIPEGGSLHVSRSNPDVLFTWHLLDQDGSIIDDGERGGIEDQGEDGIEDQGDGGAEGEEDLLPGIIMVGNAANGEGAEVRVVVGWDGDESRGQRAETEMDLNRSGIRGGVSER